MILFIGEQFLHRPRRASPIRWWVVPEYVGHGTPAHITGEQGLFIVSGLAVFRFEGFQKTDGSDIVAGFLLQAALPDPVRVGDAEIAGRFCL